jgi:hypothetical protein
MGPRHKDLVGQKFGRLTVLKHIDKNDTCNRTRWECRCDCGKISIVAGCHLRSGKTKSCGCLHRVSKLTREEKTLTRMFQIYKHSAKRRNLSFVLTKSELKQLVLQDCFYCRKKSINGIDRLDSSKGYISGNCVPCCKECNFMKRSLSLTEFLEKINKIGEKFGMWSLRK